jgi:hypothetical protein
MRTFIGTKLLSSKMSQPTQKPFEIYDSRLCGFTLRVQPTGVRSYYARFGRNRQSGAADGCRPRALWTEMAVSTDASQTSARN